MASRCGARASDKLSRDELQGVVHMNGHLANRHALHGVVGVTVRLIALVCDMLLRTMAGAWFARSGDRRKQRRPANRAAARGRRAAPWPRRFRWRCAPARVSCRRHVVRSRATPTVSSRLGRLPRRPLLSRRQPSHQHLFIVNPATFTATPRLFWPLIPMSRSHRSPAQSGRLVSWPRALRMPGLRPAGASRRARPGPRTRSPRRGASSWRDHLQTDLAITRDEVVVLSRPAPHPDLVRGLTASG